MIKLGARVKDCITGFTGIVVTKCYYLDKRISYEVCPEVLVDGKILPHEWIDGRRLEVLDPTSILAKKPQPPPGIGFGGTD